MTTSLEATREPIRAALQDLIRSRVEADFGDPWDYTGDDRAADAILDSPHFAQLHRALHILFVTMAFDDKPIEDMAWIGLTRETMQWILTPPYAP